MTVKAADIKIGSVLYPSNYAAIREVWFIEGRTAHWRGYDRRTGECWDHGMCSVQHLAQWAERLCTEEEIVRLKR